MTLGNSLTYAFSAGRRDKQTIRETRDWDNYVHPLHKRDPYHWPSW